MYTNYFVHSSTCLLACYLHTSSPTTIALHHQPLHICPPPHSFVFVFVFLYFFFSMHAKQYETYRQGNTKHPLPYLIPTRYAWDAKLLRFPSNFPPFSNITSPWKRRWARPKRQAAYLNRK